MDKEAIKILVAEDDIRLLRAYRFSLVEAGYDVTAVSSGEAARSALKTKKFDIAITDIQMGDAVSGVSIAGRGVLDYPDTKIVVVTGMKGLTDSAVGRSGFPGAHTTLFKPLEPSLLVEKVEEILAE